MTHSYTTRLLTASEKGEQDEQVWRAQRIRAQQEEDAARERRTAWLARLRRAG